MTLRDRLRARQLPTQVVTLPGAAGEPGEDITLRALPAPEWEALVALHPTDPGEAAKGAAWDVATFRPALLEKSVACPDGEEPLTAQDWSELIAAGAMTAGEINLIFNTAVMLNDRTPDMSAGKD